VIQDGYGDMVPDEEFVERWIGHAHASADRAVRRNDPRYDDVLQEALIEIWRTAQAHPGAMASYVAKASKYHAMDIAMGARPMLSTENTPGPKYRPETVAVDWQADKDESVMDEPVEMSDPLAAVEWGYHHGFLAQVLDTLRPDDREYVVRRFWLDQSVDQISDELGIHRNKLDAAWKRRIKPRLAKALELLAS